MTNHIPWTSATEDFDRLWVDDDIVHQHAVIPDIMATMFAQQRQHMEDYRTIYTDNGYPALPSSLYGDFKARATQQAFRDTMGYLIEELNEARNLLKAKPWKNSWQEPDMAHLREELADAWHFFIELCIISGMTPESVFQEYFRKSLENDRRKVNGY